MAEPSTAELVTGVADDVRLLIRKELQLARVELVEVVESKLKGAGIIAGAAIALIPAIYFLVVALALALPVSDQSGYAIVGGVMLVVAAVAVLVGIRMLKRPAKMESLDRVKEDAKWAREQMTR